MKREEWEDEDINLEDMPELEDASSANDDISGYSDKYFGRTGYGAEMEEEVNKRGYPLGAYDIFGVQGYGREMESEVKKRKKANTPPPDFSEEDLKPILPNDEIIDNSPSEMLMDFEVLTGYGDY